MRITDENGNLDEGWLLAAELVIRMGLKQFPDSAALGVLYSNFLFSVRKATQTANRQLKDTRKLPLSMEMRFQIFCKDREAAQGGGAADKSMDLVVSATFPGFSTLL